MECRLEGAIHIPNLAVSDLKTRILHGSTGDRIVHMTVSFRSRNRFLSAVVANCSGYVKQILKVLGLGRVALQRFSLLSGKPGSCYAC